jgi:hypothetical protein
MFFVLSKDPYLGYLCPALGVMNGLSLPIVGKPVDFNKTFPKSTDTAGNYFLPEVSVYGYITSSRLKILALIEENDYPVSPTHLKEVRLTLNCTKNKGNNETVLTC